jgi:transposase
MESYSKELRRDILRASAAGANTKAVALRFKVSESWVRRVKQEHREQGKVAPAKTRVRVPKWMQHTADIQRLHAEQPDLTLEELKAALQTELCKATLCKALRKLKLTFKKKVIHAAEQDRPDVAERRLYWQLAQQGINPEQIVFLDEFGATTKMTRTHGRALQGTRLVEKVPHGHWKSNTFVAGLRSTGLVAPLAIDGAMNGELFEAYVKQQLVPTLRPGDLVILDNLPSHKRTGARLAIEAVGAQLIFLPPYSPDFNPIEQAISKLKRMLRSAKQRTIAGLQECFGKLLDHFGEHECRNYFKNSGYRYS